MKLLNRSHYFFYHIFYELFASIECDENKAEKDNGHYETIPSVHKILLFLKI